MTFISSSVRCHHHINFYLPPKKVVSLHVRHQQITTPSFRLLAAPLQHHPAAEVYLQLASIQDLRDTFRNVFFPGISLLAFVGPAVLVGLIFGSYKPTKGSSSRNASTTQTTSPPPESLPSFDQGLALKLFISIILDLIGDGSFLIPGAGEGTDFLWAPISAIIVRLLYGNNTLALVNFVEELFPFSDVVPTATLSFVIDFFFLKAQREDEERRKKQNNDSSWKPSSDNVIDVKATTVRKEKE